MARALIFLTRHLSETGLRLISDRFYSRLEEPGYSNEVAKDLHKTELMIAEFTIEVFEEVISRRIDSTSVLNEALSIATAITQHVGYPLEEVYLDDPQELQKILKQTYSFRKSKAKSLAQETSDSYKQEIDELVNMEYSQVLKHLRSKLQSAITQELG